MKTIKKQKSNAFNKDIYLLGEDKDGIKYWLEAPSWDCGWYWGFGYVETYTNNKNPSKSRDIMSHQHLDVLIEKKKFPFEKNPFSENELKSLIDLFKSFYSIKGSAKGNRYKNEVTLPIIMTKIIDILYPFNNDKERSEYELNLSNTSANY